MARVGVRISWNDWKTFDDCEGRWVQSLTSSIDLFLVDLPVPTTLEREMGRLKADFALRCIVNDATYWSGCDKGNFCYYPGEGGEKDYSFVVLREIQM